MFLYSFSAYSLNYLIFSSFSFFNDYKLSSCSNIIFYLYVSISTFSFFTFSNSIFAYSNYYYTCSLFVLYKSAYSFNKLILFLSSSYFSYNANYVPYNSSISLSNWISLSLYYYNNLSLYFIYFVCYSNSKYFSSNSRVFFLNTFEYFYTLLS
jgi:hypothetical protein